MKTEATLFLTRGEVASLPGLDDCIDAVEEAFRLHAEGSGLPPGVLETADSYTKCNTLPWSGGSGDTD